VTEAVGQFEDGEHQLTLGRTALLQPGLQRQVLDLCCVGRRRREVNDGLFEVGLATPAMSVDRQSAGFLAQWIAFENCRFAAPFVALEIRMAGLLWHLANNSLVFHLSSTRPKIPKMAMP
jgi:hypothetical protein